MNNNQKTGRIFCKHAQFLYRLKRCVFFSSHNGHNDFDESKIPHLKPPKNVAAVNKKQVTMKSTKASRAQSRQGDLQARPNDSLSQLKSRENPRTSTKHM